MTMASACALPIDRLLTRPPAEAIALVGVEGRFSYGDLDAMATALAAQFHAIGLVPGNRVASWVGKTLVSAILPFACARAGLIHVPVNPLLKPAQVAHIVADSGAALLLLPDSRISSIQGRIDVRLLAIGKDWESLFKVGASLVPVSVAADDLAALLYTSGSTGRPKGVMVSHRNLWLGAQAVASYLGLRVDDHVLAVLPFSFDYGLNQMLSMFYAGGTVILHDYLLAKGVLRAAVEHEINVLAGVPPLWNQLADAAWPDEARQRMRVVTNSGGAMPVALNRRLRALFPNADLHLMYGLTEAFRSTSLDPRLAAQRPESVGRAIPHAEVLVVRGDGTAAADGEPGELVHCGPLVAHGYWRDAERTAARFRPAPSWSSRGGTAVWSGDIVVRDGDGLLSFVGRADEMIKTAGYRVSPSEIEEAALASGAVGECAAFAIADDALGQAIALVATKSPTTSAEDAEGLLQRYLRSELPNFMQPRIILWRGALPRNPNGKLDRAAMKAELVK